MYLVYSDYAWWTGFEFTSSIDAAQKYETENEAIEVARPLARESKNNWVVIKDAGLVDLIWVLADGTIERKREFEVTLSVKVEARNERGAVLKACLREWKKMNPIVKVCGAGGELLFDVSALLDHET